MSDQKNYFLETLHEDKLTQIIPSIVVDKNKYFESIKNAILRDNNLLQYTYNKESCIKLVCQLEKLARVGLTIGGINPQAYIVGYNSKKYGLVLSTIPTADGYKFIATTGKNAIFKNITLHEIHENDNKMFIDEGQGKFENPQTIESLKNKGKIVGYVFDGVKQDGFRVLKYVSIEDIEFHKQFTKQDLSKPDAFWNKHYKRMCEKTAIKHVLRDFIYVCEGLANIEEIEEYEDHDKMSNKEKAEAIEVNGFEVLENEVKENNSTEPENKNIGDII